MDTGSDIKDQNEYYNHTTGGGADILKVFQVTLSLPVDMLPDLNNRRKFEIIGMIFSQRYTAYEIALLLYEIIYDDKDYTKSKVEKLQKQIEANLRRYSREYDGTKARCNKGYKKPLATRRWISSKVAQKERHGQYEYLATPKGRRIVCDCNYRISLGHTSLKWDGSYYLPRSLCSGSCDICPMRPE